LKLAAPADEYDFSQALTPNRLRGLWRMMSGFQLQYIGATSSLAVAACAKTATFLLLRYFVDVVLGQANYDLGGTLNRTLIIIAFGFIGLATIEGSFSYFSGRLAAYTADCEIISMTIFNVLGFLITIKHLRASLSSAVLRMWMH
jgi:ATP-binding cassette subfamily B protein